MSESLVVWLASHLSPFFFICGGLSLGLAGILASLQFYHSKRTSLILECISYFLIAIFFTFTMFWFVEAFKYMGYK